MATSAEPNTPPPISRPLIPPNPPIKFLLFNHLTTSSPLHIVRITFPAPRFNVKRSTNVRGRNIPLINSTTTIKGTSTNGHPVGTSLIRPCSKLHNSLEITKQVQIDKANEYPNTNCPLTGKKNGKFPDKFSISTIRNRLLITNGNPESLNPFPLD